MAPKDILTKEFLEEHYILQRKSIHMIKDEFGIKSSNSVTQALKRYNLYRRAIRDSSHILTKEFLENHYVKQKKSLKTIVREIGFANKGIVKRALVKYGIEVRKHSKSEKFYKNILSKRFHHAIGGRYFNSIKRGAVKRGITFNITVDQIYELFLTQNGKCSYSNIELYFHQMGELPTKTTASLDRIDSFKGYTIDNIQWVHKDINRMKMTLNEDIFVNYCHLISSHRKTI